MQTVRGFLNYIVFQQVRREKIILLWIYDEIELKNRDSYLCFSVQYEQTDQLSAVVSAEIYLIFFSVLKKRIAHHRNTLIAITGSYSCDRLKNPPDFNEVETRRRIQHVTSCCHTVNKRKNIFKIVVITIS